MSWHDELVRRADARASAGLVRETTVHDPGLIDLAGNDYLGLRHHPRVLERARRALNEHGTGAGASRLVTGTQQVHADLEQALAGWTGAPAALALSTGYAANLAAVCTLADRDTLIVSDAHAHASLIDAARLSRAAVAVAPHGDVAAVARLLKDRQQLRALVVVESVFSVLGDAPDLDRLLHVVSGDDDALLLVDEAHGLGLVGPGGRGAVATLGPEAYVHTVVTTSLSKSLATQGGAVLTVPLVRDELVNAARAFIYDTGLSPANAGAALGAIEVLHDEPDRGAEVLAAAARLAGACGVSAPAGAVLSVPMASPEAALAAVDTCADRGLRIGCFRPPSTPDGISRLRLTAHAGLSDDDLSLACSTLREVTSGRARA